MNMSFSLSLFRSLYPSLLLSLSDLSMYLCKIVFIGIEPYFCPIPHLHLFKEAIT